MNRFLQRLGARAVDGLARVEPRLTSRFEPTQPGPGTPAQPLTLEDSEPGLIRPATPASGVSAATIRPSPPSLAPTPPAPRTSRGQVPSAEPGHPPEAAAGDAVPNPHRQRDPRLLPEPPTRALALDTVAPPPVDPDQPPPPTPDDRPTRDPDAPRVEVADESATVTTARPRDSRLRRLESSIAALEAEVSELADQPGATEPASDATPPASRRSDSREHGRSVLESPPAAGSTPPAIHLHIGRVIVRAQQPGPAPAVARSRGGGTAGTLEQYLARRSRGTP